MKLIFWIFLLPLIPIVYFYYIDGYIEENINLVRNLFLINISTQFETQFYS